MTTIDRIEVRCNLVDFRRLVSLVCPLPKSLQHHPDSLSQLLSSSFLRKGQECKNRALKLSDTGTQVGTLLFTELSSGDKHWDLNWTEGKGRTSRHSLHRRNPLLFACFSSIWHTALQKEGQRIQYHNQYWKGDKSDVTQLDC